MAEPRSGEEAPEEYGATEDEFDAHGEPDAGKPHGGGEQCGDGEAYEPDAAEIHRGGDYGVADTYHDTVGDDGGGEHRFGEGLDTEGFCAEVDYLAYGRHYLHDEGSEDIEYDSHEGHYRHAETDGDVGETARKVVALGAEALADECGGCVADAVTGHVADALGCDGECVGGYGHDAERGYYYGDRDLGAAYDGVFEGHRRRDFKGLSDYLADRTEAPAYTGYRHSLLTPAQVPHHGHCGDHLGQNSAKGGSKYPETRSGHENTHTQQVYISRRENKEEVEQHVKDAHHNVEGARHLHVAATPQHASPEVVHGQQREGEYKDKEVERRFGAYCLAAAEPPGERPRYKGAYRRHGETENQA